MKSGSDAFRENLHRKNAAEWVMYGALLPIACAARTVQHFLSLLRAFVPSWFNPLPRVLRGERLDGREGEAA
jgi:hypothetical protein